MIFVVLIKIYKQVLIVKIKINNYSNLTEKNNLLKNKFSNKIMFIKKLGKSCIYNNNVKI